MISNLVEVNSDELHEVSIKTEESEECCRIGKFVCNGADSNCNHLANPKCKYVSEK